MRPVTVSFTFGHVLTKSWGRVVLEEYTGAIVVEGFSCSRMTGGCSMVMTTAHPVTVRAQGLSVQDSLPSSEPCVSGLGGARRWT
ncbi:uncharacterized protein CC84DRAFT_1020848 [Paraphaeosphaeria sporulosa]|uniref:Uncharacterized protein n=1 Tax=Paraphaeosphaeria sporulosa TaxID=1460663 RepID=A0A177C3W7_9PLEO|nr:uncharacterized protein CC84DRAFT_1020848 [Paraphaeosphaeria sporulosa]OAG02434.1 hypothetical protein CC84DRAFT_1020848 [Paraphaeosphaeria sporulosa]